MYAVGVLTSLVLADDHKLYLQVDPPLGVGQHVEYTHEIVPFRASPTNWTDVAASLVQGWPRNRNLDRASVTSYSGTDPTLSSETNGDDSRVYSSSSEYSLDLVDPSVSNAWIGHPAVGEVRQ